MLEVHIPSVGPEAEGPRQSPEKGHMVSKWMKSVCGGSTEYTRDQRKRDPEFRARIFVAKVRGYLALRRSLGQWSGLLRGRVEQRGGPFTLFFQVCVGFRRGFPDGGTPSRLCAFQTPEIGRVSRRGSYCILRTRRPRSSARQVFQVEVLYSGRRHTVPRRYSEFHALHKRVRCRRLPPRSGSGLGPSVA